MSLAVTIALLLTAAVGLAALLQLLRRVEYV
jgi:hypothetical protein